MSYCQNVHVHVILPCRLEAELEERRLKEREALMGELQSLRDAAQKDMDYQRVEYEEKLANLTRDMVGGVCVCVCGVGG